MFYGIVDAASLVNPTILNNFKQRKVTVQFEPESPTAKYHYIFLIECSENQVDLTINTIQHQMLPSWYTFFWDDKTLLIVFNTRCFTISLTDGWVSKAYQDAQALGKSQGIHDIYLDFKQHFQPYKDMLDQLT